jgi:hypothetical protein
MRDPRRTWKTTCVLCVSLVMLAGCGGASSASVPTATIPPTVAPAPTATATPHAVQTTFTCPTTVNGSEKVFADASLQLSFTFPASWTEHDCERTVAPDGTQSLWIGNLFNVETCPRNGLMIQQWVASRVDTPNETVTLNPLAVPGAVEGAAVRATPTPAAANQPFQSEPFASTIAVVAGTQQFYEVYRFIAEISVTDTGPPLSGAELAQQVVTTFIVP